MKQREHFKNKLCKLPESNVKINIFRVQGEKSLPFAQMLIDSAKI